MSLAQKLLAEFEEQAAVTRRFLERLPQDKLTWKPHQKSLTAGQLALHIARIPGAAVRGAQKNPAPTPDFNSLYQQPSGLPEVLNALNESIVTVSSVLPQFDDAKMQETWRLLQGDTEILAVPRAQFLRDIMLNHWYQHRGQFGVYLRLLNVPVPASWGPSADERFSFPKGATA